MIGQFFITYSLLHSIIPIHSHCKTAYESIKKVKCYKISCKKLLKLTVFLFVKTRILSSSFS